MTSSSAGEPRDGAAGLRLAMRDLVALSALPAVWSAYDSEGILGSLAEVLQMTLALELVYARSPVGAAAGPAAGEPAARTVENVRYASGPASAEAAAALGGVLAEWLRDPFSLTAAIPHPAGEGILRIAITRFGYGAGAGILVAGSRRPDFPTEQERLLLSVGANQAAIAVQRKRVEEERLVLLEREREAHHEARTLNEVARSLGAELDLQTLVQKVTDAGTELTAARFGAFFFNGVNEQGDTYLLYTLSGARREDFEKFGVPRPTALFGPTFRGEGVVRIADVLADPRYGQNPPHRGMPEGHLPVRSYLAVPLIARSGTTLGGLFFGHPEPGVFTERAERLAQGLAAQAAVAIDNAQLYGQAQREIAERRRVEESERAARLQAEQASRLRDEFLATVSHELRTPLNSILGWAQVVRRAPRDEATLTQALEAIERGARAQTRLIEDLLDMSRIISGKLRLEVQTVALAPLVEAAVNTVKPAAAAKDIRVEQVLDPVAGPVKGDPSRLQQIFWNLLSNAVKFTPKGGKVQVHLERIDSHVEVCVSDTGRGIAEEFLPFVFDRFRQADSSTTRRQSGLGLGLAVVKQLVELHGGKVTAKSSGENLGATFTVQLPIAIVQGDAVGREHPVAALTSALGGGDEPDLENLRLLVVDDDGDTRTILGRVLAECGAMVDLASSATEALQHLEREVYQVIVSDIGMPDMDGYELMRQLRARGDKTPAIAVTAFARAEDRIRSLQAGYNMHVSKPLEPRELVAVVASLVRLGPPA
jgi:signal transduction histidine kinase